jgi:hypothetical protein
VRRRPVGEHGDDRRSDVAVVEQADTRADLAHFLDQVLVARAVEQSNRDLADRTVHLGSQRPNILAQRAIDRDPPPAHRADDDLIHVGNAGVKERPAARGRYDRNRTRAAARRQRRSIDGIDRDVDRRAVARAERLADVEHRRFIFLALADDDHAVDVDGA